MTRTALLLTCSTLWSAAAYAFCGTYVGQPGDTITSSTGQVLLARDDGRTTLTLVNSFDGAPGDFAMVIPIPTVLTQDDVRTVIPELLQEAERYSGPRFVEYTCEDFYEAPYVSSQRRGLLGCGDKDSAYYDDSAAYDTGSVDESGSLDTGWDVDVEAELEAGEYRIVILGAEDSGDLLGWLNHNGYGVSDQAQDMLQEYIDGGSYFLAAQVSAELLPPDASVLSPLQISYESEAISLPIRLGTANSPGVQDLLIYGITSASEGQLAIANYPEASFQDECMASVDGDFGAFYATQLDRLLPVTGDAHWIKEYGWAPYHCDPCPDDQALPEWVAAEAGFSGGTWDASFTRLRVRYTPEQATQDLSLYTTSRTDPNQVRYIRYDESLEDRFDVCNDGINGLVDDPGDCQEEWLAIAEARGDDEYAATLRGELQSESGGSCASARVGSRGLLGLMGLFSLAVAGLRRRGGAAG